ncbi:MAG: hypothetical protein JNM56_22880 [Planctomycetia bacterium]|nr:hypothetical protein [Planctomycetia bacterium]
MPTHSPVEPEVLALTSEMKCLVERAEQGDQTALEPLRKLLADMPALWRHYGDLAAWAERAWLDLVSGHNLCLRESLVRQLQQLRDDLGLTTSSPLEKLLIQRVSSSWLMANYADAHLAQLRAASAGATQIRVVENFGVKAHNRYLAAIRQLAQVRKLLTPTKSPIEIATRMGERRSARVARSRNQEVAIGVEN